MHRIEVAGPVVAGEEPRDRRASRAGLVPAVLVGATAVKLLLAAVLGSTVDVLQIRSAGEALLAGRDLLDPASTEGNPTYLLLGHSLVAAASLAVANALGTSFDLIVKVPAILADLGIAWLLRTLRRGGDRAALLYMLNPLTVLLSAYHGQLHTVAVLGTVATLWLTERQRPIEAAIVLALAVSVRQHVAVLLVALLARVRERRRAIVVAFGLALVVVNAPLLVNPHIDRVLAPASNYGLWGYAMVVQHGPRLVRRLGIADVEWVVRPLNRALEHYGAGLPWLWAAVFVAWVARRRPDDLWRSTLLFLLGIYAVGTGFGVQRLVWALPFWLVVDRRGALAYSGLAGAYLAATYWQWTLNAKYGVGSLMASLHLVRPGDLAGIAGVGALGLLTWAYSTRMAWRLARS